MAFRVAEEVFGGRAPEQVPLALVQRARGALRDDNAGVQVAAAILLVVLAAMPPAPRGWSRPSTDAAASRTSRTKS